MPFLFLFQNFFLEFPQKKGYNVFRDYGPKNEKEKKSMEKFFKVREHGSTVRTEITAGITTFMAMAYILMVNAGMFANLGTVTEWSPKLSAKVTVLEVV